jgi:predicted porin
MGMHRFRAQYQNAGDTKGANQAAIGTVAVSGGDTGAQIYGLQYGYALSKRTEVYGFYSLIDNDSNGRMDHSGAGATGFSTGMDVTAYGVGIVTRF